MAGGREFQPESRSTTPNARLRSARPAPRANARADRGISFLLRNRILFQEFYA
jgi:hypothetical protein